MIPIKENISLRPFNTFGIDVRASHFCEVNTEEDLRDLISSSIYRQMAHLALGEGSNVLFTGPFEGLVVKMNIKGLEKRNETDDKVTLRVGAGESWHEFVLFCVANDYGGVENLSLIPGTCGAAPMQNIGAYGVEIESLIENVSTIDALTGQFRTFEKDECRFGYRESIFKHEFRKKYFISSITLSLSKKNHSFNIQYGALRDTLKRHGVTDEMQLSVKAISEAVMDIRRQKLPDVQRIGSAGSFFKNPTITLQQLSALQESHPEIPFYPSVNQNVKVPAGWLIERCGWKGKKIGNIGVHEHQALVLVNYGGGTGEEIFLLAMKIRGSVIEKFDVVLETEVNIIGSVF